MNYSYNAFCEDVALDVSLNKDEALMLLLEFENLGVTNDKRYPSGKLKSALKEYYESWYKGVTKK